MNLNKPLICPAFYENERVFIIPRQSMSVFYEVTLGANTTDVVKESS